MKKEEADPIKKWVEDDKDTNADPLDYMSQQDLENDLECLELIKEWLSEGITNYSLDTTHDLIDEDQEQMIRVFWFSRGLTDTFVCLDSGGNLTAFDPDISYELLGEVCLSIDQLRVKD